MALKFMLVLVAFGVTSVLGEDFAEDAVYKQEHCIQITPETKKILEHVILDIGDFFTQLTMKYEDFDIRYVKVDIEKHSEDEVDEKDMILKVHINDCNEQGKAHNQVPNAEQQNNKNSYDDADKDFQINSKSEDIVQEVPTKHKNNQKQDQETYNQENVNEKTNDDKIGSQNKKDQNYFDTNTNFDNTDNQSQNQMQFQHETSVGYVKQNNEWQADKTNHQLPGCNCKEDTSTGLNLDIGDNDDDDDEISKLLKDFDFISAVSMQKPTVTMMHLPPNGEEMMNFMSSRKKKKIQPVWVYMLEEDNKKEYVIWQ